MTFDLAYLDEEDLDLWDEPEDFTDLVLPDAEEIESRWATPVVRAEWRAGDWWLDWDLVRNLWLGGAYFVIVLAGPRFWCLPEAVLRDISLGLSDDPWVSVDPDGLLFARDGYADVEAFTNRSPREVMAILARSYTRRGERRKRGPDWGWHPD